MKYNNKPTLFITASRAIIVRNFFLHDFFTKLMNDFNVVVFTTLIHDADYMARFGHLTQYALRKRELTPFKKTLEDIFMTFYKGLIYNPTVEVRTKYGLLKRGSVKLKTLRYFIQKYIFGKLLGHTFIREALRRLDRVVFPSDMYTDLIEKHKPVLLLSTSISDLDEVALVRNCKQLGIKVIGMQKSWDNASKFGYREKAHRFYAWSEYVQDEICTLQDYAKEDVYITGIPQFDYYKKLDVYSREEFCKKYNLDPNKKIIVFGSEGPVAESDPYIVKFLKESINKGVLRDHQILVRPHFSYSGDEERFTSLVGTLVKIDMDYKRSNAKDGIELSLNTVRNLMAQVRYSDVFITSASTLVLDCIANGKYPLLYAFDENKNIQYKDSTKRLYDTLWFREIRKMNLDNIAEGEYELLEKIKIVESNPNIKKEERENLIKRFCYTLDGHAGDRIYNTLIHEKYV